MKCNFIVYTNETANQTLEFMRSIGMSWLKVKDLSSAELHVDFVNTPDVLTVYELENTPSICAISTLGVSFYLAHFLDGSVVCTDGSVDGVVFCPMSNIKSINTVGRWQLEKKTRSNVSRKKRNNQSSLAKSLDEQKF